MELKSLELVKELLKCPKVDSNFIDSGSHRYLYDLAAESSQFHVCLELELAFIRNNSEKYTSKRAIKNKFHDLHEFTVEMVVQNQLMTCWFQFRDDPRGPFELFNNRSLKLPFLPDKEHWIVLRENGSIDENAGWTCGHLCNAMAQPLIINWAGDKVITSSLFKYIDNYRYRLLARLLKNKNK